MFWLCNASKCHIRQMHVAWTHVYQNTINIIVWIVYCDWWTTFMYSVEIKEMTLNIHLTLKGHVKSLSSGVVSLRLGGAFLLLLRLPMSLQRLYNLKVII